MNIEKIIADLKKDPTLAPIVAEVRFRTNMIEPDVYSYLLRAIIYQQISTKAANNIHARFIDLFDNGYPNSDQLLSFSVEDLRAVGLSRQKAGYVLNIAEAFQTNKWHNRDWLNTEDEVILKELTTIKGIGVWTVQMVLMFALGKPDVFPSGDLGIQNSMKKLWRLEGKGKALTKQMEAIAEHWKPWRSFASFCLWSYANET